jgi:ABC-type phosphate transport system substrate-binding protein
MSRKLFLIALSVVLIGGAAGCGSSSTTTTTTTSPASTAPATTNSSGAGAGASSNPAVAKAVAKCKSVVNGRAGFSAGLKSKLIGICNRAAHGNTGGVKQILGQVCTQIVNTEVPSSAPKALKDQALSACKKAFA